jgi:hypothetical protein
MLNNEGFMHKWVQIGDFHENISIPEETMETYPEKLMKLFNGIS